MMIPLSLLASAALAAGSIKVPTEMIPAKTGATATKSAAAAAGAVNAAAIPPLAAATIPSANTIVQTYGPTSEATTQAGAQSEGDEGQQAQAAQRFDKTAKSEGEPVLGPVASMLRTTAVKTSLGGRVAVAALTAHGRAVSIESLAQAAAAGSVPAALALDVVAKDRVGYALRNRSDGEKSEVWERKTAEAILALNSLRVLSETAAEPVKTKAGEFFNKHAQTLAEAFKRNSYDRSYAGSPSGSRSMKALVAVKAPQAAALLEPLGHHPVQDSYSYTHYDPDYSPSIDDYQARQYLHELGTPEARAALDRIEAQRVADQEAYRQRALRDHEDRRYARRAPPAREPSDFSVAVDISKPFWEREAALARMHPKDAAFWSRDVTLPSWTRERFQKGRRR